MKTFSQRLKWLGRKLWLLVRVLGLLVLAVIPIVILNSSVAQVAQWAAGLVSLVLIVFMYWRAERNGLAIWNRNILTWNGFGLVALTFSGIYLSKKLGYVIMDLQGIEDTANQLYIEMILEKIPAWLAFINFVCLPAISEEIIVRGYLFKKLFEKYKVLGIVVSGLIFALLHGPTDLGSWVLYSLPGFLYGYLYYKTDYLVYPMAVHFINNAWAFLAYYYL
ncbi:type II CAAX prenyl endopeptidase Rce1 family protein [Streptococcus iners]|uniref:Type II CAAX endopeptidase family protein n=1 Tax=Streptococcus iners subsp. hyiners TaxID=3028083 RepID=A0AA96VP76_9STRE|nr:type II CAAX endopeptidase family protein [Streptococcus sp. 29892]MCK4028701.1 CPBP family intramembrane metalloprotease [Streptococcus suis]WNY48689.1 type II CAAX endopeptidase family protein [Streptococcus sp. 29892]